MSAIPPKADIAEPEALLHPCSMISPIMLHRCSYVPLIIFLVF
jgi:hypothetical protein